MSHVGNFNTHMAFFDDIITLAMVQCTTSPSQRAILVLRAIFGNMVLKYLKFEF